MNTGALLIAGDASKTWDLRNLPEMLGSLVVGHDLADCIRAHPRLVLEADDEGCFSVHWIDPETDESIWLGDFGLEELRS